VLLSFALAILFGVLIAAVYLALRYRGVLTGTLVGLISLIVVQAAILEFNTLWLDGVPIWLSWAAGAEISVVPTSALALLAIALTLGALEREKKSEVSLIEQTAVLENA
tara:strand:+ start:763 stop:1089 length:327 start_codon:yes stop_codon:yes gene_type:complete